MLNTNLEHNGAQCSGQLPQNHTVVGEPQNRYPTIDHINHKTERSTDLQICLLIS